VAFVECMALGEIAFQCRQWTITGASRSPVHVIMANTLLLVVNVRRSNLIQGGLTREVRRQDLPIR
jgi:hypothetical protein